MHREVAVEPGDLERAPRPTPGEASRKARRFSQPVRASISTPRAVESMNFDLARGRRRAARVLGAAFEQAPREPVRVVEVELAGEPTTTAPSFARFRDDPPASRRSRPESIRCPRPWLAPFPSGASATPRRATRFKHRCSSAANEAPYALPMEVAEVAARAAGENFPVGSILFPARAAATRAGALLLRAARRRARRCLRGRPPRGARRARGPRSSSPSTASRPGRCCGTFSRPCASSASRASRSSA